MQTITTAARLAFETSPVKRKYKCFIDWITKGSTPGVVTAGEFNTTYFSKDNVKNDEDFIIYKPFILSDSMRLGDNVRLVSNKYENGWMGANRSDGSGVFNLLLNPEFHVGATANLPLYWGLNLTPTLALAADTLFPALGGNQLTITGSGAANEGIVITGSATNWLLVKPSTTYALGFDYKVTAGDTLNVVITSYNGATAGTLHLNDTTTNTSTTAVRKSYTFTTDATATNLHLLFRAKADGDIVIVSHLKLEEGSVATPFGPIQPGTLDIPPATTTGAVISDIYTLTTPSNHITVFGSRYNYPVNMDLYYRNSIDTAWVLCQSYTNLTSYITIYNFPTLTTIKGWKVKITKINLADMFACIAEVQAGFREDVTADLTSNPMDIDKELEYSGASVSLGNISANILTLRLNNTSQKYNPENTSSYLYPFLKYNKIIQPFIGVDLGDSIEWFAQGKYYLRSIDPKPDMTVEIYAVDRMYFLKAEDFSSSVVYENYTKSELQQMLAEAFGLGATEYAIDATTDNIPYAYFDSINYGEAIKRLEIADGGVAFFDELGIFISKTRGWSESGVAAYYDDSTIKKDSASSPVISTSMKNYIRIKSNPLDSAIQEIVYNSSQSITIPAGSSKDVPCYFNKKPCIDIVDATFTQSVYAGAPAIMDSYSEGNRDSSWSMYAGNYTAMAQSFTGDGGVLNSCKFYLSKLGSPTGNAVAKIYAHTGTFGVDGKPTGAALATSDNLDVSTLATNPTFGLKIFTFTGANKITLTNGTKYVVSIEYSSGDGSNRVLVGNDISSPSHAGNFSFYYTSWSATNTYDVCFYIYSDTIAPNAITLTSEGKYSFVTFLTFTNSAPVDVNVLTIEIQAKPLEVTGANEVVSKDVDLIAIYGKSEYLIDSEFIQDMVTAQTLADDLLVAYKDPEALEIEIEAPTRPYLQLGDTVLIRNSKLSIGG